MTDYTDVFATLLDKDYRANGSDEPSVPYVQALVVKFQKITCDRTLRMKIISELVGREIFTTKALRVGEVAVLMDMLDDTHFVNSMRREYLNA